MNEMKTLLNTIETAIAEGATTEARAHGAEAAMTLHTLLKAAPGTPLAPQAQAPSPLGQMVQRLRNTPQDLILDGLIAKLRSHLPSESEETTPSQGLRVPFIPLQMLKGVMKPRKQLELSTATTTDSCNPTVIELPNEIPPNQIATVARALASSLVARALATFTWNPANDN